MRESMTYQFILDEGRAEEARRFLFAADGPVGHRGKARRCRGGAGLFRCQAGEPGQLASTDNRGA